MKKQGKMKTLCIFGLWVLAMTAIDQVTKWLAVTYLKQQNAISLIPGVFELHYLENRGSAFGMMQGQRFFFVTVALLLLLVIPYVYSRIPSDRHFIWLRVISVMFLAGAVGNTIDRILYGYVIDFFYFVLIDFPIFNVADIYVTVGVFTFILLMFFYYSEEDLAKIFSTSTR